MSNDAQDPGPTQEDIDRFNAQRDIFFVEENLRRAELGKAPLTEKEATEDFSNLLVNIEERSKEIYTLRIMFEELVQTVADLKARLDDAGIPDLS